MTLANLGLASPGPSHAPTTRPGSAMTLGDSAQPLVVMRKQDLDDFLRETKSRCESRVDHVRQSVAVIRVDFVDSLRVINLD